MLYEDNYLAHHGIKGMRWGVRRFQNEDGTLTEAGKKQSLADLAKSSIYGQDSTKKQIQKHPLIKEAAKNASGELKRYDQLKKECQKEEDAFYKNEELYEKYLNKAVDIAMTEDWSKKWSRKAVYDWYKYDDGDQGENSSIELYARSAEGKKLAAAQKAADDAYRAFTKTIKSTLKDAMGEYGDQIINPGAQYSMTVLNRLSWEAQKLAGSSLKVSHI